MSAQEPNESGPFSTLMDTASGCYLVTTGVSTHLIDLDEMTILWSPIPIGEGNVGPTDADVRFRLTFLRSCTVGRQLEYSARSSDDAKHDEAGHVTLSIERVVLDLDDDVYSLESMFRLYGPIE